jgi:hypothetical protein
MIRSRLEFWAVLAACGLLTAWYAYPQILFSLYAPYEMLRLLFPGLLPDLASAARELLQRLGVAG